MQPPLTDAEKIVYRDRLTKAEAVYHDLMTGRLVEQWVDQNGEQVKYTKTTIAGLEAYIQKLRYALNPALKRCEAPRPLRFIF